LSSVEIARVLRKISSHEHAMKILVAGVGNVLRGDDGFGVEVARALIERSELVENVEVFEAGIAGIALVQQLMDGYDVLIVADSVERNEAPGTIFLLEPDTSLPLEIDPHNLHNSLVDSHYAEPSKVLVLAKALGVLPPKVFIVACQPASCDEATDEISAPVRRAVTVACSQIESLTRSLSLAHENAPSARQRD
jgi:hydrogenase maturation protease